jgi:hypothetical protein
MGGFNNWRGFDEALSKSMNGSLQQMNQELKLLPRSQRMFLHRLVRMMLKEKRQPVNTKTQTKRKQNNQTNTVVQQKKRPSVNMWARRK